MKLNIPIITERIASGQSDDEIVQDYKDNGYSTSAVSLIIQRCKIKMGLKPKNPGVPIDPKQDWGLRTWNRTMRNGWVPK